MRNLILIIALFGCTAPVEPSTFAIESAPAAAADCGEALLAERGPRR